MPAIRAVEIERTEKLSTVFSSPHVNNKRKMPPSTLPKYTMRLPLARKATTSTAS